MHAYAYSSLMMIASLAAALACGPKPAADGGDETDSAALSDGATGPSTTTAPTSAAPDDATGPASPTTAPESDPACPGGVPLTAAQLAYTESDVPAGQDPTVGIDGLTTGPGELEPGTLILLLSDQALTCADPQAELDCPNLAVSLLLLPDKQTPGIYQLDEDSLRGYDIDSYTYDDTDGPECSQSASTLEGELEITAIDGASVTGRACVRTTGGGPWMGGSFTAQRCS